MAIAARKALVLFIVIPPWTLSLSAPVIDEQRTLLVSSFQRPKHCSTGSLLPQLPAASEPWKLPWSTGLPPHRRPISSTISSTRHRRAAPGPSRSGSGEVGPRSAQLPVVVRESSGLEGGLQPIPSFATSFRG